MKWNLLTGLLFCSTCLFVFFPAAGQTFYTRKYTQTDGYSATIGYEINQDEKGYIWIGTDIGAIRFDGINFQLVKSDSGTFDSEILYCRPINAQRTLLLPLSHDFSYFEKGRNITSSQDHKIRGIGRGLNKCQRDAKTGTWWLSNDGRLDTIYNFTGNGIRMYTSEVNRFKYHQIINRNFLGSEHLNLYSFVYNIDAGSYQFLTDSLNRKIENELILNTGDNTEYVTTYADALHLVKIYKYKGEGSVLYLAGTIVLHEKIPGRLPFITIDRNNNLWLKVIGSKGILYYGSITGDHINSKPQLFFASDFINSIFVDRDNNIWASSPDNNLYYLSKAHFLNLLRKEQFPLVKMPRSIAGNKNGTFCIGYSDTSIVTLINSKQHQHIPLGKRFVEGCRRIYPIGRDSFIMYDRGITILNGSSAESIYLWGVFKDVCFKDNFIYAASAHGVYKIDLKTKAERSLFGIRATALEFLQDSTLIIGTPAGLYILRAGAITADKISNGILNKSNITDIVSANDTEVLIATNTNGLFILHAKSKQVRAVNLPGEPNVWHIRGLYRQDDKRYWLATNTGALALTFNKDLDLLKCRDYTSFDGLPSNSVSDICVHRDTAYICTSLGLGIIPLYHDTETMSPAEIFVNYLQSNDAFIYEPENPLTFHHDQNNITVSLSAISYESLGDIKFYYRLYPYQHKWIQVSDPIIRFTELPPGEYELQCFARNAIGIESKKRVNLNITIEPAFWQTNTFKLATGFFCCLLLYFLMYGIIKKRELKKFKTVQQKKRLAELELEAIKAQINPHFIFNCLNSIQYLNCNGDFLGAQDYLEIFAKIIRLTMKYSQQVFISIADETDYLRTYLQLEKLRFKERLDYEIQFADGIDERVLVPAMLIQPYVENALKHGVSNKEAGKVYIKFETIPGYIRIMVKDNGPGFSDSLKPGALGLRISGTRAKSYNELYGLDIRVELYNERGQEGGAVVKITIPR